jgi:hypothetical protein
MFMHPYISREPARDRQRDMLTHAQRLPAARRLHAESGTARHLSSPGSACAVPCAQPLACARHPRHDTPSQRWPARGRGVPGPRDRGMNPAPDHRDGPAARHSLGEPDHDR